MEILQQLETQTNHIATLKTQVLQPKKIQLHSGLAGFNSPNAYGIYKHTGGDAIGVVGEQFEPMDLQLFLDAIEHSVLNSGLDLDLTKLTYNEHLGGSKVTFRLPLKKYEIQSPMVGDIMETALEFRTGFDGKTKVSLGFFTNRLWCKNGAKNWQKDVELSFKNTAGNIGKVTFFASEIIKVSHMNDQNFALLNLAAKKSVSQKQIDQFLTDLTGYNVAEYNEMKTRKRNIIDAINEAVAIEMQNTGATWFSLLQGVTRYTTHNLAGGEMDKMLFSNANTYNTDAHNLVLSQFN